MKLEIHHSLVDAEKVLAIVKHFAKKIGIPDRVYFVVESYVNCREQGYSIIGSNYTGKKICNFYASIAQHRMSDSIVVCLGMCTGWDVKLYQSFCGNIAEERVWAQAQTFAWDKEGTHYKKAAMFILEQMEIFANDPTLSPFYLTKEEVAA
jgi:hypothetical protein